MAYPDHEAIIEDGRCTMTYIHLWQSALRVATYLNRNAGDDPFIGLRMRKSTAYIVSLLGVWMSGRAFVPIGLDLPEDRQKYILDHAEIKTCIDADVYAEALQCVMAKDVARNKPSALAYMIYSSGTTGTPKGILLSHAGLCNLASCQQKAFEVTPDSRYLFFLSINFDASISDMLVTLTSGAALVIETCPQEMLASNLFEIVFNRNITHLDIPPALLKMLHPETCPDGLRTIVIGGEAADINTVRIWSQKLNLVNVYGPTEVTVCTSMCRCHSQWCGPVLGTPLDHTTYTIYSDGKWDAEEGELWISGVGLAVGYYKDEALTSQKFPFVNGVRYYRTSDHVRLTENKEILFVGRMDRQVKYHGQLIELEEIESVLRENKHVKYVAVVKRSISVDNDKECIVAFVQQTSAKVSTSEVERQLRECCKHRLPKWMMPTFIAFVDAMPMTPTGKIAISALVDRPLKMVAHDGCFKYENEEEKTIASAMADLLKLPGFAPDDDFYHFGGDSLDTLSLTAKLRQKGIVVTPSDIQHYSTPRSLAQFKKGDESMCMSSSTLEREWTLEIPKNTKTDTSTISNTILITGATGFLGSHLLSELLQKNLKIKCLVRCPSPAMGLKRIEEVFVKYALGCEYLSLIEVISGDFSLPKLGLAEHLYEQLACEVSEVFHCGAVVNMLASYETLKACNVVGTRNIIHFCLTGRKKKLHYASTLSVFVSTDRNTGVVYENDPLEIPTKIYGGYGQTKFVAEKMVQAIPPSRCDVFIYRFGLLCGDTKNGISTSMDFLNMFFRGARKIGFLPYDKSESMAVDITPVDIASRIVTDIADHNKNGIYHIASEKPLMYNQLCDIMMKEGHITDILDFDSWQKMAERYDDPDVQASLMGLCRMDLQVFERLRYMDLFQTTGIRFDMTNTHAATDLRCVQNEELIKMYLNHAT